MWGSPKSRGTFLGVPMIRIVIFWALFCGPPVLGNYHMGLFGLTHPRHQTFTSLSVKTQLRWNSQMSVRVQGAKEAKERVRCRWNRLADTCGEMPARVSQQLSHLVLIPAGLPLWLGFRLPPNMSC